MGIARNPRELRPDPPRKLRAPSKSEKARQGAVPGCRPAKGTQIDGWWTRKTNS